jgi:biotin carboxyl carrier protein
MHDGETVWISERIIVSPTSGVFLPRDTAPEVDEGTVIGVVRCTGDRCVEVRAPFAGRLVRVVALEGERVAEHDRIAWMRAA